MKRPFTIEDTVSTDETKKFGFHIGQTVEVTDETDHYLGRQGKIFSFNKGSVEVEMHVGPGERPDGVTFFPDELRAVIPEGVH